MTDRPEDPTCHLLTKQFPDYMPLNLYPFQEANRIYLKWGSSERGEAVQIGSHLSLTLLEKRITLLPQVGEINLATLEFKRDTLLLYNWPRLQ